MKSASVLDMFKFLYALTGSDMTGGANGKPCSEPFEISVVRPHRKEIP